MATAFASGDPGLNNRSSRHLLVQGDVDLELRGYTPERFSSQRKR